MDANQNLTSKALAEHFFRNEYGNMVAYITKYLTLHKIKTAEDIVQDTLAKAVSHWQIHGIPESPKAWLYRTARNTALNTLKRDKHHQTYLQVSIEETNEFEMEYNDSIIKDDLLKMMFVCCHPSLSEKHQIALILKILCGFSIAEIASSFLTSEETINKRLVRARKKLKTLNVDLVLPKHIDEQLPAVLTSLYLLFNEGYKPTLKNQQIRFDFCLDAIRLTEIIANNSYIENKSDVYALLSLMYLNASRFNARLENDDLIEMHEQDRNKWDNVLINKGLYYLDKIDEHTYISQYHLLAAISAHHCVSKDFDSTNWDGILELYNHLIKIDQSPIVQLNRCVALSYAKGAKEAITVLKALQDTYLLDNNFLFHVICGELYRKNNLNDEAKMYLNKALLLASNPLDKKAIEKKIKKMS